MGPRALAIASEISQVGGPTLTHGNDAAVYLVHFGNVAALIDAGCGRATDRLLQNIEAAGVSPEQIRHLLLTHCHYDHSGAAADLRQRFGWPVAIHALEAEYLENGDNQVSALRLHLGDVLFGQLLDAIGVDDAIEPTLVPIENLRRRERDDTHLDRRIGRLAISSGDFE